MRLFEFKNNKSQEQSYFFQLPFEIRVMIYDFIGKKAPKNLYFFAVTCTRSYIECIDKVCFYNHNYNLRAIPRNVRAEISAHVNRNFEEGEKIILNMAQENIVQFGEYQKSLKGIKKTAIMLEKLNTISDVECFQPKSVCTLFFPILFASLGAAALLVGAMHHDNIHIFVTLIAAAIAMFCLALIFCFPGILRSVYVEKMPIVQNEHMKHLRNFGTFSSKTPTTQDSGLLEEIKIEAIA